MELNKKDGGNRQFILCTNNENNICEKVTYQRTKTIITGIKEDKSKYSDGLPNNLKYLKCNFINKEDYKCNEILNFYKKSNNIEEGNDSYFQNTDELINCFNYIENCFKYHREYS